MMELAREILEDGEVTKAEATRFRTWVEDHPDVVGIPGVEEAVGVITNVLDDGRLSGSEKAQLAEALERFGG